MNPIGALTALVTRIQASAKRGSSSANDGPAAKVEPKKPLPPASPLWPWRPAGIDAFTFLPGANRAKAPVPFV